MSYNVLYTTSVIARNSIRQNKSYPAPIQHSIQLATLLMYYHLQHKLYNKTIPFFEIEPNISTEPFLLLESKKEKVELTGYNLSNLQFSPNIIIE